MARTRSAFAFKVPRFTPGVSVLLWTTFVVSVVVNAVWAWGPPGPGELLRKAFVLIPGEWHPWTWFTAVFLISEPINLLLTCLMLFWWGTDLESVWGRKRMLTHFFLSVGAGGLALSLLGLLIPKVAFTACAGGWTTLMPLLMGIALSIPSREMRFLFVPPFQARLLVPIATGILLLTALMTGAVVPLLHAFFIQLAAIAFAGRRLGLPSPSKLWLRIRVWWFARRMKGKLRVVPGLPSDDELGKPRSGSRGSDNYLH
jgi:membrane associated rhomboid family serine protease